MKKIILTIAIAIVTQFSYAQSPFYTTAGNGASFGIDGAYLAWNISGSGGETNFVNNIGGGNTGGFTFDNTTRSNATTRIMTLLANGNVGIGISVPNAPLHIVKSSAAFTNIPMQEWSPSITGYDLTLSNYNSSNGIDYRFTQFSAGTPIPVLTFQGGNVGIGTTTPDAKLAVLGTIHAKEVKVDLGVPGPDYVFSNDYKLTNLNELKLYLENNHHLPEIPSADQMAKEGINLSEMNVKLLKKVEELTLYLIKKDEQVSDQAKRIAEQNKKIEQQQQVNQSLQAQINELAKKLNK